MRRTIGIVAVLALIAVLGGAALIYTGFFSVAATERHSDVVQAILEAARVRSIKAHAAGIAPPVGLDSQARIVPGTAHFAEHCATCHSAPGVQAEDMAEGMYPKPPVLTEVARHYSPGELFWILKNGIKMSGMPSWGDHGDEDLWNTVAFLEKLPGMSAQDYRKLVAESVAGGHHMHGDSDGPVGMDRPMAHTRSQGGGG